MATRYDANIGDDIVLEALFKVGEVAVDVDVIKVELVNDELATIDTVVATNVVKLATGHYQVTFLVVPEAGQLCDNWVYKPTAASSEETLTLSVFVTGVGGEAGEGDAPIEVEIPDIGADGVCLVTHRFIDGSGNALQGIYVRFRPVIHTDASTPFGTVARDTDAVSDAEGNLSIYLVRNVTGTLAISGVGLVRTVTVPDRPTCPLYELIPRTADLYEVQSLDDFIDLPKRS